MRRRVRLLLPLLVLAAPLGTAQAQVSAGFVLGMINRVRKHQRRQARIRKRRIQEEVHTRSEAAMERLRSPYADERERGIEELLELAQGHAEGEHELEAEGKLEVVLERALRDESWKVRWGAQRARAHLGLIQEQGHEARFQALFGRRLEDLEADQEEQLGEGMARTVQASWVQQP